MTTTPTDTGTGTESETRPEPQDESTTPSPVRTDGAERVRIDPRIRERRIEVIRQAGRRRLRVLLVVSTVLIALGIAFLVVTSPLLDVDHMTVTGARHVTAAEVRAASGVHLHDHLPFVDLSRAAHRIEQLPWVRDATVRRKLPGTLAITIIEYSPVAYVRVPGGVMLVAANGHVIDRAPTPPPHTVEVRGVRLAPSAGNLLAPSDAAGIVGRLPAVLARRIGRVDVSGDGLTLDVVGNGEIRLGDSSDLGAKATAALAVLTNNGAARFRYIDVSTPDRAVLAR